MANTKYSLSFSKLRDGQSYFERHVTRETLELLLIMCSDISIRKFSHQKTGTITFSFSAGLFNYGVTAKKIPDYILRTMLSEKEWEIIDLKATPQKKYTRGHEAR